MDIGGGLGTSVGAGVGAWDDVAVVLGAFVGSNAGFCVSVAMGVCINSGDGVSAGAWVAPDCATVVGSGVGEGTVVAVGPAGTVVAADVGVCYPPQAPRAIRTVR